MKKVLLTFLFLLPLAMISQTSVSIKDIDYSLFPLIKAQIRAISNSQQITIDNNNLLFIEGSFTHRDFQVSAPSNGWQAIEWIPDHNVISNMGYYGSIAFTHGKQTAFQSVSVVDIERLIGTFQFKNASGENINDLQFINTAIGDTSLRALSCEYFYNLLTGDGFIRPIRVDSLSVTNDNFLFEWRGNQFEKQPPPTNINFTTNQILVRFAPKVEGSQSAILKVHYNRGAVAYIRLQGNKNNIKAKTNLKVISPNGGEVFTPCQDTIVTWEGNVKNITSKVELSYNNGQSWSLIDSVIADTLDWKIPSQKTSDFAKVRVSQAFTQDPPFIFEEKNSVFSTDYNFNATTALSFSEDGIFEWDLVKLDNSKLKYDLQTRSLGLTPVSTKYIADDKFAAIYRVGTFDSLAVFKVGQTTPIYKESIKDFDVKEIYPVKGKDEFIILPQNSNYFRVFNAQDFSTVRDVIYNQPITDIGVANDSNAIVVAGLDGNMYILSKNDYQSKDNINFYRTPIIQKVSISSNGLLIGMSSVARANGSRTNSMIWDLESRNIITSLNISGSEPTEVGFSPTGNMAVFAYQYQNQINIYDLVRGSQSGVIETFQDPMVDLAYSSQNNSFLVSAAGVIGPKFKQYFFTFPETDESDSTFRIVNPVIVTKDIDLEDWYIFDETKKTYSIEFCNRGEVPLFIEDAFFKNKVHFSVDNFSLPDTLLPGECIDITIAFNPKDTSIVRDSLIIASCSLEYPVFVKGNGLNRNIEFSTNVFDLGEVCLQDTNEITTLIFKNLDPVNLLFNKFEIDSSNTFAVTGYAENTVLNPGESITATIKAFPPRLGDIISDIHVMHSNQQKYKATAKLKVKGIGTFVEVSHTTLPFIPEQRIRKITIKNIGIDPVEITGAVLNPVTDFKVNTPTPIFIQPGQSIEIEIEWIGNDSNVFATLEMEATPCLTQRFIDIVDYRASSELDINDTDADPLDTTSISISFTNIENASYKGLRIFEAVVTIDPKMFIPEYAVSEYGEATIENMGIENGKRLMKLRVNGDFSAAGTLAKIVGYPGLSEKNTSTMLFDNTKSSFWGASTTLAQASGLFTLLLTCNDQTIIHNVTQIQNVSPNPASNVANIQIVTDAESEYELIVSSNDGRVTHSQTLKLSVGENIVQLNSSAFDSGNYIISLKKDRIISSKNLVIIK